MEPLPSLLAGRRDAYTDSARSPPLLAQIRNPVPRCSCQRVQRASGAGRDLEMPFPVPTGLRSWYCYQCFQPRTLVTSCAVCVRVSISGARPGAAPLVSLLSCYVNLHVPLRATGCPILAGLPVSWRKVARALAALARAKRSAVY